MDCETCRERRVQLEPVPYVAHESAMARLERTIRRLWLLLVLVVVLLVATNAAWLWYESQFVEEEWIFEADTRNGNAIANGSGEVNYYGESESNA